MQQAIFGIDILAIDNLLLPLLLLSGVVRSSGMGDTTSIEIDFEVYKLIEAERKGFDEPRLAALRRLLGLKNQPQTDAASPRPGLPWIGAGVELPHGTEVKMFYSGRQYDGEILNGKWHVDGGS